MTGNRIVGVGFIVVSSTVSACGSSGAAGVLSGTDAASSHSDGGSGRGTMDAGHDGDSARGAAMMTNADASGGGDTGHGGEAAPPDTGVDAIGCSGAYQACNGACVDEQTDV